MRTKLPDSDTYHIEENIYQAPCSLNQSQIPLSQPQSALASNSHMNSLERVKLLQKFLSRTSSHKHISAFIFWQLFLASCRIERICCLHMMPDPLNRKLSDLSFNWSAVKIVSALSMSEYLTL